MAVWKLIGAAIAVILLVEATPVAWAIDLSPVAVQALDIIQIVAVILGGILVRFAVSWLSAMTGLRNAELEAVLASQANAIINRAIGLAYTAALAKVNDPNNPLKKVEFDNVFINMAVNYAIKSMPGIIAKFGLTEARLREMIIARLPDWISDDTPITNSDVKIAEAVASRQADLKI